MSLTLLAWRRRCTPSTPRCGPTADPAAAHETWRAGRDELLAHHPDSPLMPEDRRRLRRRCRSRRTTRRTASRSSSTRTWSRTGSRCRPAPTAWCRSSGSACCTCPRLGDLDVWWLGSYGGACSCRSRTRWRAGRPTAAGATCSTPSRAPTSAATSTRDGRGTLVVDLNFAYNPSCAYDPAWACPLAPPGNTLAAAELRGRRALPGAPAGSVVTLAGRSELAARRRPRRRPGRGRPCPA